MRLFVTTAPKTGTHLLWHTLGLNKEESVVQDFLLAKNNSEMVFTLVRFYPDAIVGHIPWSRGAVGIAQGFQKITLLRDPRDVIVSWHHFMDMVDYGHPFERFVGRKGYKSLFGDERMSLIIDTLDSIFDDFLPWLQEDILVLRYEEMLSEPEKALEPLAAVMDERLDVLVERSKFRGTETFRKATPGDWKREWLPEHLEAFNNKYSHIMEAWGYDKGHTSDLARA